MKQNYTHLTFLIDRSGSMSAIAKDMIGGIKNFVEEQKKIAGEATISIYSFDSIFEKIKDFENLQDVVIGDDILVPRGPTALLDAACRSIDEIGTKLGEMKEGNRPDKVIFIIITDGEENSSREFKAEDMKTRIQKQEKEFDWKFVFLGANFDVISAAKNYGFNGIRSTGYVASAAGVSDMTSNLSASVGMYRSGKAADLVTN